MIKYEGNRYGMSALMSKVNLLLVCFPCFHDLRHTFNTNLKKGRSGKVSYYETDWSQDRGDVFAL